MSETTKAADDILAREFSMNVFSTARELERKAIVEFLDARSHPSDLCGAYAVGWGMCAYDAARCIERGDHLP